MQLKRSLLPVICISMMCFISCGSKPEKPNILLITVDTLRSDHVGAYGYPRNTTPFIDKLAKEGLKFKNVITSQPQTSGSHATILTSLHPVVHGLIFNALSLSPKVRTIAQVLKDNGYYTIGTVSVKILSRKYGFDRGFDSFSDQWEAQPIYQTLRKKKKQLGKSERTAPSTNQSLISQIKEYKNNYKDKPLFIWLHYFDPHAPYFGRKEITFEGPAPLLEGQDGEIVENYDREIRFTDDAIKAVYGFLESEGLARDLVTCITADHGEGFGEYGQRSGHIDFYSASTYVPLIFHGPGIPGGKEVTAQVSTMDVAVSLLGQAGLSFADAREGIDLLGRFQRGVNPPEKRKFLIINSQRWARSLQMVGAPYSYIFNCDRHYLFWYAFMAPHAPLSPVKEELFKPLPESRVNLDDKKKITMVLPPLRQQGLHYLVLRTQLVKKPDYTEPENPPFIKVRFDTYPQFLGKSRNISLGHPEKGDHSPTLEVVYPVTIADSLKFYVALRDAGNVKLENVRYAYIRVPELAVFLTPLKKIDEPYRKQFVNWIWSSFLTFRKNLKTDELFNLTQDRLMSNNLIGTPSLKRVILKYKKLIHDTYLYYLRQNQRLQKGIKPGRKRSSEDEKLLKSLGYI